MFGRNVEKGVADSAKAGMDRRTETNAFDKWKRRRNVSNF